MHPVNINRMKQWLSSDKVGKKKHIAKGYIIRMEHRRNKGTSWKTRVCDREIGLNFKNLSAAGSDSSHFEF